MWSTLSASCAPKCVRRQVRRCPAILLSLRHRTIVPSPLFANLFRRARLNELLAGIDVDIPGGHIKVVEVEGVNGDATINIRKVGAGGDRRQLDRHGCHLPTPSGSTDSGVNIIFVYAVQGRKIVVFDLAITARWEGQLLDGDGRLAGTGDGDIVITGLDQDSTSTDYSLKIKPSEDGGINDRQLARLMDKWGSPVVRKKVWQFVEELRAKE